MFLQRDMLSVALAWGRHPKRSACRFSQEMEAVIGGNPILESIVQAILVPQV